MNEGRKIAIAKSLSERIALRTSTRQPTQTGKNRASFLALREDVKKALNDGWPVKVIWNTLRDERKIEFGYDAFIGYVNRLIRNLEPALPVKQVNPVKKAQPKAKAISKKEVTSIAGFNFNCTPKEEDLF